MISAWAPLALTAATGGMLALPLTPAVLEILRRKDAGPLPTRKDDGDIRNFARSFRRYIDPLHAQITFAAHNDSIMEARLPNGSYTLVVGKGGLYPLSEQRVGTMVGRTRRIAIVAMARKLLIALWRYVETGTIPAGVEFDGPAMAATA